MPHPSSSTSLPLDQTKKAAGEDERVGGRGWRRASGHGSAVLRPGAGLWLGASVRSLLAGGAAQAAAAFNFSREYDLHIYQPVHISRIIRCDLF